MGCQCEQIQKNEIINAAFFNRVDELIADGFSYEVALNKVYNDDVALSPEIEERVTVEHEKLMFNLMQRKIA